MLWSIAEVELTSQGPWIHMLSWQRPNHGFFRVHFSLSATHVSGIAKPRLFISSLKQIIHCTGQETSWSEKMQFLLWIALSLPSQCKQGNQRALRSWSWFTQDPQSREKMRQTFAQHHGQIVAQCDCMGDKRGSPESLPIKWWQDITQRVRVEFCTHRLQPRRSSAPEAENREKSVWKGSPQRGASSWSFHFRKRILEI